MRTNSFLNALQTRDALTENGMVTNSTSGSRVMDLFYGMGGSRQLNEARIAGMFSQAFIEDRLLATKALFYNRDVRGGQGERRSFRIMFEYLCSDHPEVAIKNLVNVPFYGRWDDLFVAVGTPVEIPALDVISTALKAGDKLCAKWMPREGKHNSAWAKILRTHLELTPKQYRKLLAGNTQVIESFMCSGKWENIDYNHVPSVASNKYRHAFGKHDYPRYSAWLESLTKPESGNKIHADAIFPHIIVHGYIKNYYTSSLDKTLEAQWLALPDYVPEGHSFIPVCDVSGSMRGEPLEVSISLGVYLSQRNKGPFKDAFLTFSAHPKLQVLTGNTLRGKIEQLETSQWDMNTDVEAVFKLILSKAKESSVPAEDMPETIIILSDMQFDQCIQNPSNTAFDMIQRMYAEAGYKIPNVVFWNLRTSSGIPVKITTQGTALVSGFSPSIMKNLLSGEMRPDRVMLKTLLDPRYERVVI
jgi:hypothetical protein